MNKAGRKGIWAGRGKVWLREAAVSICLLHSKDQLTVDDWLILQKKYKIVTVHQKSYHVPSWTRAHVLHVGFYQMDFHQILMSNSSSPSLPVVFEKNIMAIHCTYSTVASYISVNSEACIEGLALLWSNVGNVKGSDWLWKKQKNKHIYFNTYSAVFVVTMRNKIGLIKYKTKKRKKVII